MAGESRGIEWYKGRANYLQSLYEDRDDMYDEIDDARFGNWDLPEDLEGIPWILKSLEPAFAITSNAAIGLIAANDAQINITPSSEDNAAVVDVHEKGLGWILDMASRRRKASTMEEMAGSAINYAECATLVTYLPNQLKAIDERGGNSKRLTAIQRHGDFLIRNYHPGNVYPRYSDFGVEEVVVITEENPHDVVDLWGDDAALLKAHMAENDKQYGANDVVELYEYLSLDRHCVWVEVEGKKLKIYDEEWKWPFLPWACNITGGELLNETDKDRKPLLSIMYHFDQFDIMSRVKTLMFSDLVRSAAQARRVYKSEDPDGVAPNQDASSGENYEVVGPGEDVRQHAPVPPDPQMSALYGALQADHEKATMSDLLLGGEVPSEAAFASVNLVTHSALQAIEDARDLVARQIAEVCEIIMLWIHYSQAEVYGTVRDPVDREKVHNYLINWEDIDPSALYIDVRVDANLPIDQNERVIAGRAMIDAGLASHQAIMEDLGYTNSKEIYEQMVKERVMENEVNIRLKNRQTTNDMQIRQEMEQLAIQNFMQSPEGQQMQQLAQVGMQVMQAQQGGGGAGPEGPPTAGVPGPGPAGPAAAEIQEGPGSPPGEQIPPELEEEGLTQGLGTEEAGVAPAQFAPGEGSEEAGGAAAQRTR